MKLKKHERIVTAFGEFCSGPGWSNRLLTVVVKNGLDQTQRVIYMQPEEWMKSGVIHTLFALSANVNQQIVAELRNMLKEKP